MSNMNPTELEVKILDVDPVYMQNKLKTIGATYIGERFQEIYTYDLYPIHARFSMLVNLISKYDVEGENDIARSIGLIVNELTYLLSSDDTNNLNAICLCHNIDSWSEFQAHVASYDYRSILEEAIPIINKYNTNNNKWARLRRTTTDNGVISTTIAVKEIAQKVDSHNGGEYQIENMKETEVGIDSFELGKILLENLGYYFRNYQEKKRISYIIENVCVDIDIWPVIPPYIEIEGKSKDIIYSTIEQLGISKQKVKVISPESVFLQYGVDVLSRRVLKFSKENSVRLSCL